MRNIGLIIGVIAVVGIVGFFVTRRSAQAPAPAGPTPSGTVQNSAEQPSAGNQIRGSIQSLAARGANLKCQMKPSIGMDGGTFYIAAQKGVYGEFRTVGEGLNNRQTPVSMHVLVQKDSDTMYYWMREPTPLGFKMSLSRMAQAAAGITPPPQQQSMTQEQVFVCEPWTVDMSLFTPPADITFTQN